MVFKIQNEWEGGSETPPWYHAHNVTKPPTPLSFKAFFFTCVEFESSDLSLFLDGSLVGYVFPLMYEHCAFNYRLSILK